METGTDVMDATVLNGINVTDYEEVVEAVREEPALAEFEFRASNVWTNGGLNRTTIRSFYGAGEEHGEDDRVFTVDADEPPVLLGEDRAPNPVEYLLHALAACLTSSIVYKAASRGIVIDAIESTLVGALDANAFLELGSDGRLGFSHIKASFQVASDATPDELLHLARFSPVLDIVENGTSVQIAIEKV